MTAALATGSVCRAFPVSVAVATASVVIGMVRIPVAVVSALAAIVLATVIRYLVLGHLGSHLSATLEVDPSQGGRTPEEDHVRPCGYGGADEQHCEVHIGSFSVVI